jgi:hypothetical protein
MMPRHGGFRPAPLREAKRSPPVITERLDLPSSLPMIAGYDAAYAGIVAPSPPSIRLTSLTLSRLAAFATSPKIPSRCWSTNMSIALPPLSRHAPATSCSDFAIASPSAAIGAA